MIEAKEAGLFIFYLIENVTKNAALNIIKNTERLLREQKQFHEFSIDNIPLNDETTFALLAGEGVAEIVWFDSADVLDILRQARPSCLEDLSVLNALCRPGVKELIPQFMDCRHGRRSAEYPHPCLENILKETCGIIVYQEQITLIINRVAGYTLAQADILRRILRKGKNEGVNSAREAFVSEAEKRGLTKEDAAHILNALVSCASPMFSKSYWLSYSLLMYQCAYLKARFPKEYTKALKKRAAST
jgi:DNA polymerase-3 subunit alpha